MRRIVTVLVTVVTVCLFGSGCERAPSVSNGSDAGGADEDSVGIIEFDDDLPFVYIDRGRAVFSFSPRPTGEQGEFIMLGVGDFAALPGGGVAFSNRGSDEVAFLSRDAELMAVIGGRGEGPGEFVGVHDLAYCASNGSLAVIEDDRVTWMRVEVDEESQLSVRLDSVVTMRAAGLVSSNASVVGLDPVCRLIYHVRNRLPASATGERETESLMRLTSSGPDGIVALSGRTVRTGRPRLFTEVPVMGVTRSGPAYARGDSAKVDMFDWSGTLTRTITWREPPAPVDSDEWERAGAMLGDDGDAGTRPLHRPLLSNDMLADPLCACLMVRRFSLPDPEIAGRRLPPETWILIQLHEDPTIAELRFAEGMRPVLATEGGIWAVGEDEFGLETVYFVPLSDSGP